ncbi:MAG TPA: cupin domain-containing protein [Pseudolabrys sp.]|nr:cupin domain-containing protein [Pseudolabrys sp.]
MVTRKTPRTKPKVAAKQAPKKATLTAKANSAAGADREARIGAKVKHGRMVRGITLKQLAEEAGCSESLLSKIENNKAMPSFGTLHRIAAALGTNVGVLFSAGGEGAQIVSRAGERPIIVTDQLRTGKGVQLERLIPYSREYLLQSNIHLIAPGGRTDAISHAGEEIGYVLEGEIELTIDGNRYCAKAGDSFHFRSELPHAYRNIGTKPARVLWVNTPPTF